LNNLTLRLEKVNLNSDFLFNTRVGPLCELSHISHICGIDNCKFFIDQLSTNFPFTRNLYSDGNTFFRSFIYALLEYHILTLNITELDKIIKKYNDILSTTIPFKFHDEKIDKDLAIHIFYLIRMFLESKDVLSAYQILLKAQVECPNFDLVRIK